MKRFTTLFVLGLLFLIISVQGCQFRHHSVSSQSKTTKPYKKLDNKSTKKTIPKLSQAPNASLKISNDPLCPDGNHPHMIDLGLPSRTKWACCNIGSTCPEEFGDYYAWGETKTKSTYDWCHYEYYKNKSYSNLGTTISGTMYDVAHVKWGGLWQMPTKEQCDELINNCSHYFTKVNGIKGCMLISKKNGRSVFIPASGLRDATALNSTNMDGLYWTGTQYEKYLEGAYFFNINISDNIVETSHLFRSLGLTIRPVAK